MVDCVVQNEFVFEFMSLQCNMEMHLYCGMESPVFGAHVKISCYNRLVADICLPEEKAKCTTCFVPVVEAENADCQKKLLKLRF